MQERETCIVDSEERLVDEYYNQPRTFSVIVELGHGVMKLFVGVRGALFSEEVELQVYSLRRQK